MAEALAPRPGKPIPRRRREMTYRVISTLKADGMTYVQRYDSYEKARNAAKYLSMKRSRENVTISDEHGIKCSY